MDGVWGISHNPQAAGVSGHNPNGLAGFFDGNVIVTGDLMLSGADYAENFDLSVPAGGGAPRWDRSSRAVSWCSTSPADCG